MATSKAAEKAGDLEAGDNGRLYPSMTENPALRWAFIRKVYAITLLQLLLTVGVSATVVFVRAIPEFLVHTKPGVAIYVIAVIAPFIILFPLMAYQRRHPVNVVLLVLFTIAIAFSVGMSCAFLNGKVILLSGILASVVVVSLTLYTFWAAKQGYDYTFMAPFLLNCLLVLLVFIFIQIYIPMGKLGLTVWGALAVMVYSAVLILNTEFLIKHFKYDEYVIAAINLYMNVVNIFVAMLTFGGGISPTN